MKTVPQGLRAQKLANFKKVDGFLQSVQNQRLSLTNPFHLCVSNNRLIKGKGTFFTLMSALNDLKVAWKDASKYQEDQDKVTLGGKSMRQTSFWKFGFQVRRIWSFWALFCDQLGSFTREHS